ncbi:MAG: Gfo/Idh/MocA family oxidoreductase [Chloroflexi bacterium]|nr:Gfo/Idh/MocA family oxidoreductase [Chloroflexota bacterium]
MKKVRWGLVSTANINRRLIPAIRASKEGELTAVSSRSLASAQAYAAQWAIPHAFGSYEAMLDSDAVDAVYISLPNHLHAEWTIYALEHGKHVLCEKPFALTLNEVDAMISASERTGNRLAEAFMYRHHPQAKLVKAMVTNGRLGEITILRGAFDFAMTDPATNVRMRPEWGGGALWDVGVYPMSYAQNLMGGPPQWVFGSQWIGASGVDEVFAGQMGYGSGVMAQFSCAFRSPFHTFFEIVGTEGRVLVTRPFVGPQEGTVTFYPANGDVETFTVPDEELYLGEVEDMNTAVLHNTANFLTLAESRNHVRTILALYDSARQAEVVWLAD